MNNKEVIINEKLHAMSEKLIELRKKRKLKQRDLAELLNVSKGTYCRNENGCFSPGEDKLCVLANFYGIAVEELIDGDSEKNVTKAVKRVVGERLFELRKEKNLNQYHLSKLLKVENNTYVRYEKGYTAPSSLEIRILADFYGVSADYLLGREIGRGNDFSDEEKNLIEKFKQTDKRGKNIILNFLEREYYRSNPIKRREGVDEYIPTEYLSDVSDEQWEILVDCFTQKYNSAYPKRALINAVFYRASSDCSWENLPHDYPPWSTVQAFYQSACTSGLWYNVLQSLIRKIRLNRKSYRLPEKYKNISDSSEPTEIVLAIRNLLRFYGSKANASLLIE